jgi:hypothetical protein
VRLLPCQTIHVSVTFAIANLSHLSATFLFPKLPLSLLLTFFAQLFRFLISLIDFQKRAID